MSRPQVYELTFAQLRQKTAAWILQWLVEWDSFSACVCVLHAQAAPLFVSATGGGVPHSLWENSCGRHEGNMSWYSRAIACSALFLCRTLSLRRQFPELFGRMGGPLLAFHTTVGGSPLSKTHMCFWASFPTSSPSPCPEAFVFLSCRCGLSECSENLRYKVRPCFGPKKLATHCACLWATHRGPKSWARSAPLLTHVGSEGHDCISVVLPQIDSLGPPCFNSDLDPFDNRFAWAWVHCPCLCLFWGKLAAGVPAKG